MLVLAVAGPLCVARERPLSGVADELGEAVVSGADGGGGAWLPGRGPAQRGNGGADPHGHRLHRRRPRAVRRGEGGDGLPAAHRGAGQPDLCHHRGRISGGRRVAERGFP